MMRRSSRIVRQSALQKLDDTSATEESSSVDNIRVKISTLPRKTKAKKRSIRTTKPSDASDKDDEDFTASDAVPTRKKRKVAPSSRNGNSKGDSQLYQRLFSNGSVVLAKTASCSPPSRAHNADYHRPLLLDSRQRRASLLSWFDSVSSARSMPWRKAWIDPRAAPELAAAELRRRLERRAYEVWISEIMLQQTRVAVVIDYWNRWMEKWPTIRDLAAAEPDEVLAAWRGLGYYSRATRIHQAARLACEDSDMDGLLPSNVDELVAKVPGVGRYTAGAISAIVFGRAAPMVDGNVLRVLSRQLGVFGDVKADKSVIDLLWAAADGLVKAVAGDLEDDEVINGSEDQGNDRPGRWGQALMELGSTVCTPKPNCVACPISSSCRAYSEGLQIAERRGLVPKEMIRTKNCSSSVDDIEDTCNFCKPFEEFLQDAEGDEDVKSAATATKDTKDKSRSRNQSTLQAFAFTQSSRSKSTNSASSSSSSEPRSRTLPTAAVDIITTHARKFPVKVAKKAVREEETLVCAVRRSGDGRYLIHRRPAKGLLAGLWEFPSHTLPGDYENTAKARKRDAVGYVSGLLVVDANSGPAAKPSKPPRQGLRHVGELGSVPWLFSHLRLTMHVHLFELEGRGDLGDATSVGAAAGPQSRWSDAVDEESMGTGMRKCWALVKEANGC